MSNRDFGDYKRSVRVKGPYGEVEIKAHDTEYKFIASGTSIKSLLDEAVDGYRRLMEEAKR